MSDWYLQEQVEVLLHGEAWVDSSAPPRWNDHAHACTACSSLVSTSRAPPGEKRQGHSTIVQVIVH